MSKYFNEIKLKSIEQVVFFDIECTTIVENLEEGTDLYESWKYKVRHEGLETFEELNDKFKKDGPLYSPFLKVCCIVCGYVKDGRLVTKDYTGTDEKEIITNFFNDLIKLNQGGKIYLASFSGVGYDMPVLGFRALVNGIELHPWFDVAHQKEWNLKYCIDLNLYLRGTAFQNLSLINAAVAFGLPSPKQSLKGDEVSNAYYQGKLDEIKTYCTKDVETLGLLLAKIMRVDLEL